MFFQGKPALFLKKAPLALLVVLCCLWILPVRTSGDSGKQIYSKWAAVHRDLVWSDNNVYFHLAGHTHVFKGLADPFSCLPAFLEPLLINGLLSYLGTTTKWCFYSLSRVMHIYNALSRISAWRKYEETEYTIVPLIRLPPVLSRRLLIQFDRTLPGWEIYPVPVNPVSREHFQQLSPYLQSLYRLWEALRHIGLSTLKIHSSGNAPDPEIVIETGRYPRVIVPVDSCQHSLESLLTAETTEPSWTSYLTPRSWLFSADKPPVGFTCTLLESDYLKLVTGVLECVADPHCRTQRLGHENRHYRYHLKIPEDFAGKPEPQTFSGHYLSALAVSDDPEWLTRMKDPDGWLEPGGEVLIYQDGLQTQDDILDQLDYKGHAWTLRQIPDFTIVPREMGVRLVTRLFGYVHRLWSEGIIDPDQPAYREEELSRALVPLDIDAQQDWEFRSPLARQWLYGERILETNYFDIRLTGAEGVGSGMLSFPAQSQEDSLNQELVPVVARELRRWLSISPLAPEFRSAVLPGWIDAHLAVAAPMQAPGLNGTPSPSGSGLSHLSGAETDSSERTDSASASGDDDNLSDTGDGNKNPDDRLAIKSPGAQPNRGGRKRKRREVPGADKYAYIQSPAIDEGGSSNQERVRVNTGEEGEESEESEPPAFLADIHSTMMATGFVGQDTPADHSTQRPEPDGSGLLANNVAIQTDETMENILTLSALQQSLDEIDVSLGQPDDSGMLGELKALVSKIRQQFNILKLDAEAMVADRVSDWMERNRELACQLNDLEQKYNDLKRQLEDLKAELACARQASSESNARYREQMQGIRQAQDTFEQSLNNLGQHPELQESVSPGLETGSDELTGEQAGFSVPGRFSLFQSRLEHYLDAVIRLKNDLNSRNRSKQIEENGQLKQQVSLWKDKFSHLQDDHDQLKVAQDLPQRDQMEQIKEVDQLIIFINQVMDEYSEKEQRLEVATLTLEDADKEVKELRSLLDQVNHKLEISKEENLRQKTEFDKLLADKESQFERLREELSEKDKTFQEKTDQWNLESGRLKTQLENLGSVHNGQAQASTSFHENGRQSMAWLVNTEEVVSNMQRSLGIAQETSIVEASSVADRISVVQGQLQGINERLQYLPALVRWTYQTVRKLILSRESNRQQLLRIQALEQGLDEAQQSRDYWQETGQTAINNLQAEKARSRDQEEKHVGELQQRDEQYQQTLDEIVTLREGYAGLKKDLENTGKEPEDTRALLENTRSDLALQEKMRQERDSEKVQVDNLKSQLSEQQKESKQIELELKNRLAEKERRLTEKDQEYKEAAAELIARHRTNVQVIETRNNRLTAELSTSKDELEEAKKLARETQHQLKVALQQLASSSETLNQSLGNFFVMRQQLADKEKEVSDWQEKVSQYAGELDQSRERLNNQEAAARLTSQEVDLALTKVSELEARVRLSEEALIAARRDADNKGKALGEERDRALETVKALENKLSEQSGRQQEGDRIWQQRISQYTEELNQIRERLKNQEEAARLASLAADEREKMLQQEKEQALAQLIELEEKMRELKRIRDEERLQAEGLHKDYQQQLSAKESQVNELTEKNQNLTRQHEQELEPLKAKLVSKGQELAREQQTQEKLQSRIRVLNNSLARVDQLFGLRVEDMQKQADPLSQPDTMITEPPGSIPQIITNTDDADSTSQGALPRRRSQRQTPEEESPQPAKSPKLSADQEMYPGQGLSAEGPQGEEQFSEISITPSPRGFRKRTASGAASRRKKVNYSSADENDESGADDSGSVAGEATDSLELREPFGRSQHVAINSGYEKTLAIYALKHKWRALVAQDFNQQRLPLPVYDGGAFAGAQSWSNGHINYLLWKYWYSVSDAERQMKLNLSAASIKFMLKLMRPGHPDYETILKQYFREVLNIGKAAEFLWSSKLSKQISDETLRLRSSGILLPEILEKGFPQYRQWNSDAIRRLLETDGLVFIENEEPVKMRAPGLTAQISESAPGSREYDAALFRLMEHNHFQLGIIRGNHNIRNSEQGRIRFPDIAGLNFPKDRLDKAALTLWLVHHRGHFQDLGHDQMTLRTAQNVLKMIVDETLHKGLRDQFLSLVWHYAFAGEEITEAAKKLRRNLARNELGKKFSIQDIHNLRESLPDVKFRDITLKADGAIVDENLSESDSESGISVNIEGND